MHIETLTSLRGVDPRAWNALVGSYDPFLEHGFLISLENSAVIGPGTAWEIRFVVEFAGGVAHAALPLFLKHDSYGEFVFDWHWAEAYQRAGLRYYPKLVAASPLTPVTGRRLLGKASEPEVLARLLKRGAEIASAESASGLHFLFAEDDEVAALRPHGFLIRLGYQFHWFNHGYGSFDEFLSDLRSSKRKQILKERRGVDELGLEIEVVGGAEVESEHLEALWGFYRDTTERKWSQSYLNRRTFLELGERFRDRLVLVLARDGRRIVAGTLNAQKGGALYGRYWGAAAHFPFLHFECCYYRLIDYAIERGLSRVEAGAQGEHKFLRGYVTRPTASAHKLLIPSAHAAIGEWLESERQQIEATIVAYNRQSPMKNVRAAEVP